MPSIWGYVAQGRWPLQRLKLLVKTWIPLRLEKVFFFTCEVEVD